jgi:AAHS family 4-hydroxybenzoate transporter-like MFS transporter
MKHREEIMVENAKIDVTAVFNDSPISRFQYGIFAICFLIIMYDGFDIQSIAYVAPSIVSEWNLAPGSFGPVFSAVILGAMLGAMVFGYLSDKFGRNRTLILCVSTIRGSASPTSRRRQHSLQQRVTEPW